MQRGLSAIAQLLVRYCLLSYSLNFNACVHQLLAALFSDPLDLHWTQSELLPLHLNLLCAQFLDPQLMYR